MVKEREEFNRVDMPFQALSIALNVGIFTEELLGITGERNILFGDVAQE